MSTVRDPELYSSAPDIDALAQTGGRWIRLVYRLALRLFGLCPTTASDELRTDLYILF
jgi:hypothetical protein